MLVLLEDGERLHEGLVSPPHQRVVGEEQQVDCQTQACERLPRVRREGVHVVAQALVVFPTGHLVVRCHEQGG